MKVTKRCGKTEELDMEKIHKVVSWASEGLNNVSVSEIELKAKIQFFNGIQTKDIHEMITKSAADLISESNPDYQYLAARLEVFNLRKEAYGQFEPPTLYTQVCHMVHISKYDSHILKSYSEKELIILDAHIEHSRDLEFTYAGISQLKSKYLCQDRSTGKMYETPQFLYMSVSACLFSDYPEDIRMDYVREFYDAISTFEISLPTPVMAGVRTPRRQFSSCTLIECGDSLDSINASSNAIVKYISQRAGIGINAGRIRAEGSKIGNGEVVHTGCIPFYKLFQSAIKSCSQGGIRGGSATLFYPIWHLEVEDLLVLKNNRGVEENRVRHIDYGVQISKLFYQRLLDGKNVTLFCPNDAPILYESFFSDSELFEDLYLKLEKDPGVRKRQISAVDLFSQLMQERASTGRIYIQNVDNCNDHGPFNPALAPIRQSNLCMEITLPTSPISSVNDCTGEIALCTLSAINLGKIKDFDHLEKTCDLAVRALDELLDYQDYPVKAAELGAMRRRSLGIGVVNFAYYLAKNGVKYSDGSAINLTHRTFEAMQFYLMKSSMNLAVEKGPCERFLETRMATGGLPIDTYNKEVDKICDEELSMDWAWLRKQILIYGMRNSTLSALMPSESSSQVSNATNGIEPPRGYVSVKQSKHGILKQVVPEFETLKENYELLWDMPNNKGYLELVAVMQKFVDQSISSNTNYDPSKFKSGKIPMKQLLKDLLMAYKLGIKTLYYHNTRDGASDLGNDCESGACKI